MQANQNMLLDIVLQGKRDFFQSLSVHSPLPGASYKDNRQTIVYCSGVDYAPCNGIISKHTDHIPHEKEIQEAVAFFKEKNLPFVWWSHAPQLEEHFFQYGGIMKGIALDMSKIPTLPSSSKVTIQLLQSQADLQAFSELFVTAFGTGKKTAAQLLAVNKASMLQEEQMHFLAYLNETPVGMVSLALSPHSAGIWNLGVVPEHRKMGIGHMLVHAALSEARKCHYHHLMAILMPKAMAWGIFKRLGFQEVCSFPFYVHGASAASLE